MAPSRSIGSRFIALSSSFGGGTDERSARGKKRV
jgi:hypothetical protein